MITQLDHLVVLATSLDEGVAWCERTLGVVPGPGGRHPLMGTHNRLMAIGSDVFPRAYFEVMAIDPAAAPVARRRWFDLDDEALTRRLREEGPMLAHWVARSDDASLAAARWAYLGIDRGELIAAQRETPRGLLSWKISVREDGQRLFDGCLPTLIQWGEAHPAHGMPASGVTLRSLSITHPDAARLGQLLHAVGVHDMPVTDGPARLSARFDTPLGPVEIHS